MKFSEITLPSNKRFGIFFIFVFSLMATYSFFYEKESLLLLSVLCLISIILCLLFKPQFLTPFNRAWAFIGFALGRIISPIVLGLIYFLVISPLAIILRIFGRDELDLRIKKAQSSWQYRTKDISSESFKNQF